MTTALAARIRKQVNRIDTMPSIPTIFLPLLELLSAPAESVRMEEVVKLVSYDNTIAAQCLRVAGSPLFGLSRSPQSIKGAVVSLGLRRVQTILLTCCLGQAFPLKNGALASTDFWRHSLGCALVCGKLSEMMGGADKEKAYMAGLLHDIGLLVNCQAFPEDFAKAVDYACQKQVALHEAELATMGFTHCETGRALAEKWHLGNDIIQVIAYHHAADQCEAERSLVALVHLSDLLCRMRGLGYGHYECQKVDFLNKPEWAVVLKEHRDLQNVDLVRFTFELDEAMSGINATVANIFGSSAAKN